MAVTLAQAKTQLNIPLSDTDDDTELQLYVDAANEWVAAEVRPDAVTFPTVTLATLILIDHLWDTQRGSSGVAPTLAGEELVTVKGPAYAIPNRVLELLRPWMQMTGTPEFSFPAATDPWPDQPRRALAWPIW